MPQRNTAYLPANPTSEDIQRMPGKVLLDFGTDWCGHCIAARPAVERWLDAHPHIAHLRIGDGRGRPLGRAYRVKLWPTLVLLEDGDEIARTVRPRSDADMRVLTP